MGFSFAKGEDIGPETVAGLTAVAREVKHSVDKPIGINCHLNGGLQALAVAEAVGAKWIRVFSWVNGYISNVGYVEGIASKVTGLKEKIRKRLDKSSCKYNGKARQHEITGDITLAERCEDAELYQADWVIVTGTETGNFPLPKSVAKLQENSALPLFVGSGLIANNIGDYSDYTEGCIVGSYFKKNGNWDEPVSERKTKNLWIT